MALDGGLGKSQLMNTATVNITIKDVNNKPPVLGSLPTLHVLENLQVGSLIYQVEASDLDDTPILRYKFNSQNCEARNEEGVLVKPSEYDYLAAFDLDPINGELKVLGLYISERTSYLS